MLIKRTYKTDIDLQLHWFQLSYMYRTALTQSATPVLQVELLLDNDLEFLND